MGKGLRSISKVNIAEVSSDHAIMIRLLRLYINIMYMWFKNTFVLKLMQTSLNFYLVLSEIILIKKHNSSKRIKPVESFQTKTTTHVHCKKLSTEITKGWVSIKVIRHHKYIFF